MSKNGLPPSPVEGSPGPEFLDDFYAECDEHLREIRQTLLKFEEACGEKGPDAISLESLFRSFHSLKGICGMAGIESAERLAHRTEDYLRALTRHESELGSEGRDILSSVAGALEQIILSHREKRTAPEMAPLLERISRLGKGGSAAEAPPSVATPHDPLQVRAKAAQERGLVIWKCTFVPAPTLEQRNISVTSVRARLQSAGEILQSTPQVLPGGTVTFEFIIAAPLDSEILQGAQADGITIEPWDGKFEQPPAAAHLQVERGGNGGAQTFLPSSHFVRVDLTRLDELMRIMGELVIRRARFEEVLTRISPTLTTTDGRALQEMNHSFARELRNLRDALMRVRLVPISEIFERLPFVVRDLGNDSGRKVRLNLTGRTTEIDKYLVERLKDPLLHLVRNAICHGIEPAEERVAQGKPAEGQISLSASTVGESVLIHVSDDGRGINAREVADHARAAGFPVPNDLHPAALLDLICTSGLSTRDQADLGAGRGVGMAAVKATIRELGGELSLATIEGKGTTFTLRLPLTLAIADALILSAGNQKFAMPQAVVQEITTTTSSAVRHLERNELIAYRNGVLPLIRLATLFGLEEEARQERPVLVIGTGLHAVGIVADRVLGQREIVVRAVNDPLLKVPAISGATELGDGRAVLILDSSALIQRSLNLKRVGTRQEQTATLTANTLSSK